VLYGTLPLEERLAGTVRARVQSEIYPELSAPVVEIYAQDGQFVSAGDPLVRLRSTEIEERLRQAESGLEVAEARVRQSETNLQRLQANLNRLRDAGRAWADQHDGSGQRPRRCRFGTCGPGPDQGTA
jgi:HlyD family secretion protein